ncbi:MAG: DUF87 domain-containing protein [Sulfolobales archaeon]
MRSLRRILYGKESIWLSSSAIIISPLIKNIIQHRNPHKSGIVIGRILNDTRVVFWDPMKAFNPHILIVGPTGSGKTETLITILRRAHEIFGSTVLFVDIRGDIASRLMERGVYYHLIDIPRTSLNSLEPRNTTPWIRVYQIFDSIIESYEINDLRLQGVLFEVLRRSYEKYDKPSWDDIITTLYEKDHDGLNGIIERILREISSLDTEPGKGYEIRKGEMNVVTMRDLTKEREELLRYAINIFFQDLINMASREKPDSQVNIFLGLDEAWILLSRRTSRRIVNLLRLARGYGISISMATQSFKDFGELWDMIAENTGLLIVMSNPSKSFWAEASKFLRIGEKYLEDIMTIMRRGDAIIRILPDPRAIPVSIDKDA